MTSTPNDGIPDAWRARYFGGSGTTTNSQSAWFADSDHDGLSNYQEFLAGTDPTNAASVLKLTALNQHLHQRRQSELIQRHGLSRVGA